MHTGRRHFFLAYTSPELFFEINRITDLGELGRVIDMRGRKERSRNTLVERGWNNRHLRPEDEGLHNYHMRTAAQAIVT